MNAGGHGARDRRRARRAPASFDLDDGARRERRRVDELGLGYRRSALGPRDGRGRRDVRRAAPTTRRRARARIDEIVRWRREHQPGGQNAGSVFTNPPGDAAGRLIEACGLQGPAGRRRGRLREARQLLRRRARRARPPTCTRSIARGAARVEAATGVRLEPELQLVGFADVEEAS